MSPSMNLETNGFSRSFVKDDYSMENHPQLDLKQRIVHQLTLPLFALPFICFEKIILLPGQA